MQHTSPPRVVFSAKLAVFVSRVSIIGQKALLANHDWKHALRPQVLLETQHTAIFLLLGLSEDCYIFQTEKSVLSAHE
jgi:hypothetical protein